MDLTGNQSSCSSLSIEGKRSFIKCGKTNLISVVSKLENLLTKVIFQFSLSSAPLLSPFYSFMYHSFVSLGNLIYYIFLWGIISLSLCSPVIILWQESLSVSIISPGHVPSGHQSPGVCIITLLLHLLLSHTLGLVLRLTWGPLVTLTPANTGELWVFVWMQLGSGTVDHARNWFVTLLKDSDDV